eukprot:1160346-Pelagomonas_calceolata.AAC.6
MNHGSSPSISADGTCLTADLSVSLSDDLKSDLSLTNTLSTLTHSTARSGGGADRPGKPLLTAECRSFNLECGD